MHIYTGKRATMPTIKLKKSPKPPPNAFMTVFNVKTMRLPKDRPIDVLQNASIQLAEIALNTFISSSAPNFALCQSLLIILKNVR